MLMRDATDSAYFMRAVFILLFRYLEMLPTESSLVLRRTEFRSHCIYAERRYSRYHHAQILSKWPTTRAHAMIFHNVSPTSFTFALKLLAAQRQRSSPKTTLPYRRLYRIIAAAECFFRAACCRAPQESAVLLTDRLSCLLLRVGHTMRIFAPTRRH